MQDTLRDAMGRTKMSLESDATQAQAIRTVVRYIQDAQWDRIAADGRCNTRIQYCGDHSGGISYDDSEVVDSDGDGNAGGLNHFTQDLRMDVGLEEEHGEGHWDFFELLSSRGSVGI